MTTEQKIIGGIGIFTIVLVVGGVFLFSKNTSSSIPEGKLSSKNSIHWHPKVAIFIKGEKQELEDEIGIGAVHQEIHTHTEDYKDGIVHMEMDGPVTKEETKLGNFFKIWGKEFNRTQLFDKKNGSDGKVKMIVNGKVNAEFENYEMHEKDVIEIRYE